MMQPKWTRVTQVDNIPLREGRAIKLGNVELAIFNLGDRVMAVESRCPHKGGPLADGIVSGKTIVCPLHGWRFDLPDGRCARGERWSLRELPVQIADGRVLIEWQD